jgi:hypothetical protein
MIACTFLTLNNGLLMVSMNSYDVTLGRYYFRESLPEAGMGIYNPFSEKMVQRVWGKPLEAERAADWMARTGYLSHTHLDHIICGVMMVHVTHLDMMIVVDWITSQPMIILSSFHLVKPFWVIPTVSHISSRRPAYPQNIDGLVCIIEFLGGQKTVTTMMKARSSLGRNFVIILFLFSFGRC